MDSKISIIIAAKGSGRWLKACLYSATSVNYPDYEVVLVDDGLDAGGRATAELFGNRIRILQNLSTGPSAARNIGARNCDGEYVAFFDSDCIIHPDCLTGFMHAFERFPSAAACGGAQEVPADATSFQYAVHRFLSVAGVVTDYVRRGSKAFIRHVSHNPSCNVAYRRDVFLQYGGFSEGLWPGEDVELDYRLTKEGHDLVWNPRAVVYHYRVESPAGFASMMYRYGRVQGILVRNHGLFRRVHYAALVFCAVAGIGLLIRRRIASVLCVLAAGITAGMMVALRGDMRAMALFIIGPPFWFAGFLTGIARK